MVNHPVAAIELPWRLMLVANSSQSSQETSFIMLTLRHGAETRTVSNAGKPGPCNHSHWITSIVIDVTSMESLHKLMVFPSHTMYSSLCHVPNRAQTGPKQGPNSSESWPLSAMSLWQGHWCFRPGSACQQPPKAGVEKSPFDTRPWLIGHPHATVHSWIASWRPKTPRKLDTNSM